MNIKKENYEELKRVEHILYTACFCNFVRIANREDTNILDRIYKETFHTDKGIVGGCSHCVYEACKKLGKLYFEDKKAYENAEKEVNIENEPVKEPKKASTQKKADKTKNKKK